MGAFVLSKFFLEKHLILENNTRATKALLRKLLDIKNEDCKCYLGNKEQKAMILVVSRSDVQFVCEHSFFLRARSGAPKIGSLERNLSSPV